MQRRPGRAPPAKAFTLAFVQSQADGLLLEFIREPPAGRRLHASAIVDIVSASQKTFTKRIKPKWRVTCAVRIRSSLIVATNRIESYRS
jgi:hypothetical protein